MGSPIQNQVACRNKPDTLLLAVSWSTGASGWHINDADLQIQAGGQNGSTATPDVHGFFYTFK